MVARILLFLLLLSTLPACASPRATPVPTRYPTPTPDARAAWEAIQASVPALRTVPMEEAREITLLLGTDVDYLGVIAQIAGVRGTESLKWQSLLKVTEDDLRKRPSMVLRKIIDFVRGYTDRREATQGKAIAYDILQKTFFSLDVATVDRLVELVFDPLSSEAGIVSGGIGDSEERFIRMYSQLGRREGTLYYVDLGGYSITAMFKVGRVYSLHFSFILKDDPEHRSSLVSAQTVVNTFLPRDAVLRKSDEVGPVPEGPRMIYNLTQTYTSSTLKGVFPERAFAMWIKGVEQTEAGRFTVEFSQEPKGRVYSSQVMLGNGLYVK